MSTDFLTDELATVDLNGEHLARCFGNRALLTVAKNDIKMTMSF
jgi:hypothetical protein